MVTVDQKVGLVHEDYFDADPNLAAMKVEFKKINDMLNAIKADINDAVANHAGALQSAITVANIAL